MMSFKYTSAQEYLEASGVLENGTPEAITKTRLTFRSEYLKHYKKQYRKTHSNVTLSFTKTDKEALRGLAKDSGQRLASFIKNHMLRLLSGQNIYSVNDSDIFMELKRLLSLSLDIIEELQFENRSPELSDTFFQLEHLFNQMCTLLDAH
ncbi:MAG: hypothetical protein EVB11_13105 [Winogradskyella sp.]|nr:MAG: hypothetical protein EVB11_13105 [Winogradskyella sp.]